MPPGWNRDVRRPGFSLPKAADRRTERQVEGDRRPGQSQALFSTRTRRDMAWASHGSDAHRLLPWAELPMRHHRVGGLSDADILTCGERFQTCVRRFTNTTAARACAPRTSRPHGACSAKARQPRRRAASMASESPLSACATTTTVELVDAFDAVPLRKGAPMTRMADLVRRRLSE